MTGLVDVIWASVTSCWKVLFYVSEWKVPMLQGVAKESLLPKFVLEVDSIHDVPPSRGDQIIPNFRRPGGALGEPFMKERALLQVLSSHR